MHVPIEGMRARARGRRPSRKHVHGRRRLPGALARALPGASWQKNALYFLILHTQNISIQAGVRVSRRKRSAMQGARENGLGCGGRCARPARARCVRDVRTGGPPNNVTHKPFLASMAWGNVGHAHERCARHVGTIGCSGFVAHTRGLGADGAEVDGLTPFGVGSAG